MPITRQRFAGLRRTGPDERLLVGGDGPGWREQIHEGEICDVGCDVKREYSDIGYISLGARRLAGNPAKAVVREKFTLRQGDTHGGQAGAVGLI
jgi:hypothetical protein